MNHAVLLRASLTVALVRVLQAVVPPLTVVATLYFVARACDEEFGRLFLALAGLASVLIGILVRPPEALVLQVNARELALNILVNWAITLGLLFGLGYVTDLTEHYPRVVVISWALLAPVVVYGATLALRLLMRRVVIQRHNERSAVIVGVNLASQQLADRLTQHRELCTRVDGFFDDRGPERLTAECRHQLLGRLSDLVPYVQANRIDVIFIALPIRHIQRLMTLLDDLQDSTASIYFVPDVFVFDLIQSRTADIMGLPVVAMRETPFFGYRGVKKRITDLAFTSVILIIALLPMLFIGLLVKLTSKGSVIFRQRRYGLDGEEIVVYKFRTMRVMEDGATVSQATRDDPRITPVGRFLRRFSLDELPQLVNVLQGRMSLVGPRPHAVAHNEQYRRLIKGYMVRHKVLPGITGLAQVSGCRGETADLEKMQQRINYDLEYLRHWSPTLDLKIIFLTAWQTVADRSAY